MNLQSEIDYFRELAPIEQARLMAVFLHELSVEARRTYGAGADQVRDGARLRFVNEIVCRLARFIEQVLADEADRPGEDVLMRMLLRRAPTRRPSAWSSTPIDAQSKVSIATTSP